MRFYAELHPSRFREKVFEELDALNGLYERIHIPDSPFGYPKASPLALAALSIDKGLKVTIHIRTMDYNETGLLNLLYGAYILGVDRVVFLYGDKPFFGVECGLLTSMQALELFANEERLLKSMKPGLLLSMRYPLEKIKDRILNSKAEFFLIINKDLEKARKIREITDKELIGYFIVRTSKNKSFLSRTSGIDVIDEHIFLREIDKWEDLLDAALISSPRDTFMTVKLARGYVR